MIQKKRKYSDLNIINEDNLDPILSDFLDNNINILDIHSDKYGIIFRNSLIKFNIIDEYKIISHKDIPFYIYSLCILDDSIADLFICDVLYEIKKSKN
jgi:hypothetical protein